MELETVLKLLSGVALAHPEETDSAELLAMRQISLALMHMADGIHEIHQTQAAITRQLAGSN